MKVTVECQAWTLEELKDKLFGAACQAYNMDNKKRPKGEKVQESFGTTHITIEGKFGE